MDLFCGAGGLTHGLKLEGLAVAAGVDLDEDCRYAFEHNNEAPFVRRDIEALTGAELNELFYPEGPRILVGCAPCQPFSTYNQKSVDPKWSLVAKFAALIEETRPDVVSMENVPRLLDFDEGRLFSDFLAALSRGGYHVDHRVVFLPEFGLPQRRSRLVLLASRRGPIALEVSGRRPRDFVTVGQTIGSLPSIAAGEAHPSDDLHVASRLSELNLRRIRASRPGGTWQDWDERLIADCHRSETGRGYGAVYGRMTFGEPSPTITTQFYGFGSGRFGHPTQDRALSLREGAMLQSFPSTYRFQPSERRLGFKKLGRLIGNAVPVLLGRAIGRSIVGHLRETAA